MADTKRDDEHSASADGYVVCPRKAFTIEISCDGHTLSEAIAHLRRFVGEVRTGGERTNMTCGNGWVRVVQNEGQTEEQYFREVDEYLDASK